MKTTRNGKKLSEWYKTEKKKFWSAMAKTTKSLQSIGVPMAEIKNHYEKLFNTRNETLTTVTERKKWMWRLKKQCRNILIKMKNTS